MDTRTGTSSISITQNSWNSSASVTIWCRVKWTPIDLNNKFRSLREAQKKFACGGNFCPWHVTRNTRDFKPLPAGDCISQIARDHFVDAIWNRAKNDLLVWDMQVDSRGLQCHNALQPNSEPNPTPSKTRSTTIENDHPKTVRVCDRNRLPWILEHRHTAQFFFFLMIQSLVEQSNVIVRVADHCQYWRR